MGTDDDTTEETEIEHSAQVKVEPDLDSFPVDLHDEEDPFSTCVPDDEESDDADMADGHKNSHDNYHLKCHTCSKTFNRKSHLTTHIRAVHDEESVNCEECGKLLKNKESLKVHCRRHHADKLSSSGRRIHRKKKGHLGYSEGSQNNLSANLKSLKCPTCGKSFKRRSHLISHINTVHDEESVTCEECGNVFKNRALQKVHYRRIHVIAVAEGRSNPGASRGSHSLKPAPGHGSFSLLDIVATELNPRRPELPLASFLLARSIPWDQIRKPVATRVEFIICDCCGQSFSSQDNFVEHSKVHKNVASYWQCELCSKLFRTEKYLSKHKRKVHKVVPRRFNKVLLQLNNDTSPSSPNFEIAASFPSSPEDNFETLSPFDEDNFQFAAASASHENNSEAISDNYFQGNPSLPSLPTSPVLVAHQDNNLNAEISQTPASHAHADDVVKSRPEDLLKCPKLNMLTRVTVTKYVPLLRSGFVFCDICCKNYVHTRWLKFHMKLVHGIEYTPKVITPRISKILAEMRGKSWKCSSGKKKRSASTSEEESFTDIDSGSSIEEDLGTGTGARRRKLRKATQSTRTAAAAANVVDSSQSSKNLIPCPHCSKSFSTEAKVKRHASTIHGDTPKECRICKKVLTNQIQLGHHMRYVHLHDPMPCEICGTMFNSFLKVSLHKSRVHKARDPDKYKCKQCDKTYKTNMALRSHILSRHENIRRFSCDICKREFTQKICLRTHLVRVHKQQDSSIKVRRYQPSSKRHFQCGECGRPFTCQITLTEHLKIVHSQERSCQCLFCSSMFATFRSKRVHESKYHGSPNGYSCKLCDEFCESPSVLERHVEFAHSKALLNELYYEPAKLVGSLELPSGSLGFRGVLNKDCPLSTEELRARKDKSSYHKPRNCAYCGFLCQSRGVEVKHIVEVHPEYAPFKCVRCQTSFTNLRALSIHNLEVHDIRQQKESGKRLAKVDKSRLHSCGSCEKHFVSADGLAKHTQTAHPT